MQIQIERLRIRELDALLAAAVRRKQQLAKRRPIHVVRKELTRFAAAQGYSIEELIGVETASASTEDRPKKRQRAKVAAKYRDPQNKRNTWSGRGSMPLWLANKARRGQSPADFLIPGIARPSAKPRSIGKKVVIKQGQLQAR